MALDTRAQYEAKKARIVVDFACIRAASKSVALGKNTSNLFRARSKRGARLNVRDLNCVITVDVKNKLAVVEGMCTFDDFTKETLRFGMLPAVVPELKTITVGGGVSGGAIESSSFKFGLVHETVVAMEILLGDGHVVLATRTNEHKDLFYGMANSYGTLGYILCLTVKLVVAKPFVRVTHTRFNDAGTYFKAVTSACSDMRNDYVDGTVFSSSELYLTVGRFVASAPHHSCYTYRKQYYRSIQEHSEDYLTAYDYVWRWDKDWFWCSKNFGMHNTLVRLTAGLFLRGSKQYWKIMQWNRTTGLTEKIRKLTGGVQTESVIQDVQIPISDAPAFLRFFHHTIPIAPVWICPTRPQRTPRYPLYDMKPGLLYVNFGFWDVVPLSPGQKRGHHNALIEAKVAALHGRKGLYSDAYYSEKDFWKQYNKRAYDSLKKKYDARSAFLDLYQKTVKRK